MGIFVFVWPLTILSSFFNLIVMLRVNMMVTFHIQGELIFLKQNICRVSTNPGYLWNLEISERHGDLSKNEWNSLFWKNFREKLMLSVRISFSVSLVCCHPKMIRNLFNGTIMHTVCSSIYYYWGFLNLGKVCMGFLWLLHIFIY